MEHSKKTKWIAGLGALMIVVAGCGSDGGDAESVDDQVEEVSDDISEEISDGANGLIDVLEENGLESVASAFESIDLDELTSTTDYTFLAPNDEAFQSVPADELAELLADPEAVTELLRNHMLTESLTAAEVAELSTVDTQAGGTLTVTVDGDTVMFDDATVVSSDIDAADGVVHVVDRLLLP